MIKKLTNQIKALGIQISYASLENQGFFGIVDGIPIIIINSQLDTLSTAITLLHETAHFLNQDANKAILTSHQNAHIEYEANRYMIQNVLQLLDQEYDFTPSTNYYQICDALKLPSYLNHIIHKELHQLICSKYSLYDDPFCDTEYQHMYENAPYISTILTQSTAITRYLRTPIRYSN